MSTDDAVSILLLALLVPDWSVVAIQWRMRRLAPANTALDSRAKMSALLSTVATMIAVLGVIELVDGAVPRSLAAAVVTVVCVAVSVPQVHWLWLWFRGTWQ